MQAIAKAKFAHKASNHQFWPCCVPCGGARVQARLRRSRDRSPTDHRCASAPSFPSDPRRSPSRASSFTRSPAVLAPRSTLFVRSRRARVSLTASTAMAAEGRKLSATYQLCIGDRVAARIRSDRSVRDDEIFFRRSKTSSRFVQRMAGPDVKRWLAGPRSRAP
jgi:hypothetical protein